MSAARKFGNRTFAALKVRNFRLYFIGQLISTSGTWMQSVAQGWLVLQISGSAVDLGFAVALQFLPTLIAGSYGGLIADRHEKRIILYYTQTAAGLLALLLGVLVSAGHVSVGEVYVIAFGLGVVNLFDTPARQAFVQQMVGRDLITNAVSLNSVLMNSGRLVGPAVSTAVIATFGTAACFYANAGSFMAVLIALWMMRSEDFLPMRTVSREKGQLRLGLHYAFETPLLRNVLIVVTVLGLFAYNFTVTLPLLARVTFHEQTATQYGLLMGAMGLGAIAGGLSVAYRSRPTLPLLAILALGFGISMNLTAIAPSIHWAQLALVPTGAFSIAMMSTANSLLQLNSSEHMRGRIMSLYAIAFFGTTPLGAPLMGLISGASNPRFAIALGAGLAVVTAIFLLGSQRSARQQSNVLQSA
ncbi:MAG TPA: MFS transporter [Acidimicrobiales bacterium]|nr:MFS transporter [Acidimicrobiales bacterium]